MCQCKPQVGWGETFDLAPFLVSMVAPVKRSINHLRILPSMRVTGNRTMFRLHFYSGFAFDSRSITLYSLLAIFNDSSMTIRTKGMKDQLCVIFLANVVSFLVAWKGFAVSGRKRSWRFYFAVVISSFITFQLHTDQLCSLISMENSDVELFRVCHYISRSLGTKVWNIS